ncbi:16S rRNA m(5)C-967 methyltransferase [Thiogranum longum]|uniref:16S rRNA (cytosine(967)-C(5))-methyltransferase n=1 Tax=Thiogranum longum TaxID=1537524 RepID=A0A4R1H8G5_9GAMM|nr:16S rRNA (cytosine(967)-C(5))-methyltransferase RsmB [Thiogranum longum]TCK16791.1 16S rRNA m(5)C-967 methyltransferase [Thiogranum longum]
MNTQDARVRQPRELATRLVFQVLEQGESLAGILNAEMAALNDPRQRAFTRELVLGTLRWRNRLEFFLGKLLQKPLRKKDRDLHALLLVGLYQVLMLDTADHAAVSETVDLARHTGKSWAAGLVNGVLRNALRQSDSLLAEADTVPTARWSSPDWWIKQLQHDWPDHWQQILEGGNQRAPMVLRVNSQQSSREAYIELLLEEGIGARPHALVDSAIELDMPVPVDSLPGFRAGSVSVQDAAAQLAAPQLMLEPGQRVLDACAAPGGKTGHIAEVVPDASLLALDNTPNRLENVEENLQRLKLKAETVCADAGATGDWWDGRQFDRILLDAPCSASGVVRRHPDIKQLRRESDLPRLSAQQRRLLNALWPLLAPGGILLYVTCSVFRCENTTVVEAFMAEHDDAAELPLEAEWGQPLSVGRQLLPGEQGMDGFYYARLIKGSTVSP